MPGEKVRRSQAEDHPYFNQGKKQKERRLKPQETISIEKKETYL